MKYYFQILFILFYSFSTAQNCEEVDSNIINCVDSANRKQGYWIVFDTTLLITRSHFDGESSVAQMERRPIAKGFYQNNDKIGVWEYLPIHDWRMIQKKHTIDYKGDKSKIIHVLDSNYMSKIYINSDSTQIHGYYLVGNDSITVNCYDSLCHFNLMGQNFLTFDYKVMTDFDYYIDRLQNKIYNREIKKINTR